MTPAPSSRTLGCQTRPCPGLPEHPGGAGPRCRGTTPAGTGDTGCHTELPQRHPPRPAGPRPAPAARPAPLWRHGEWGSGVKSKANGKLRAEGGGGNSIPFSPRRARIPSPRRGRPPGRPHSPRVLTATCRVSGGGRLTQTRSTSWCSSTSSMRLV